LGNLAPGTDTSAQVADSLLFTKLVFNATLDLSKLTLTNGSSGNFIADPTLSFTLLPSGGSYLIAGEDLGTIDASPAPEPSTISLIVIGLLGLLGVQAKKHVASNES